MGDGAARMDASTCTDLLPSVVPRDVDHRQLLAPRRMRGKVMEWNGATGWIEPEQPLDHPSAASQGGKLFVSGQDLGVPAVALGDVVSFFVYVDSHALGAMDVRLAPDRSGDDGTLGNRGPYDYRSRAVSSSAGMRAGRRGPTVQVNAEGIVERAQQSLYSSIWEASKTVMDLEPGLSHDELSKRIAKYFSKAVQAPELLELSWDVAAKQFIDHGMQCYSAGCGDSAWFFELDLAPALCACLWELLRGPGTGGAPCCRSYAALEREATAHYEDTMDRHLLERAMWDVTKDIFADDFVCKRVYKYLADSHSVALAAANAESTGLHPLRRVEKFLREWMEQSITRAWQSIDNSGVAITEELVLNLFQNLIAPFGEDHPFSCVPTALTESIGRPPHDWPFMKKTAKTMFESWRRQETAPASKRRKKSGASKKQGDEGK